MTVQEVITHFGSMKKSAEALDVSFQAIHRWKERDHVPAGRQWQLQAMTAGKLRVDEEILARVVS